MLKKILYIQKEPDLEKKIELIVKDFNITYKEFFENLGITYNAYLMSKKTKRTKRLAIQVDMWLKIKELEYLLEIERLSK